MFCILFERTEAEAGDFLETFLLIGGEEATVPEDAEEVEILSS